MTKKSQSFANNSSSIADKLAAVVINPVFASTEPSSSKSGPSIEAQDIMSNHFALPEYWESSAEEARAAIEAKGNPYGHDYPDGVVTVELEIKSGDRCLSARLYRPESLQDESSAALVFFHGGGFVFGSVDAVDKMAAQLAFKAGISVISASYGLAPEHPFPVAIADAVNVFRWVAEHSQEFNIDANRIAIGGESAGASLAAAAAIELRDLDCPKPQLQLLLYPMTAGATNTQSREVLSDAYIPRRKELEWLLDLYIPKAERDDPRFNLLMQKDLTGLPPAFVVTAGFDPLMDEGAEYIKSLSKFGVPTRHSCYHQMIHAFLNFQYLPEAEAGLEECAQVLTAILN